MINCEELKQLKDKLLLGDVSPGEEEAIELHLENCPSCRQMLDEWLAAGENNKIDIKKELSDRALKNGLSEKKQRNILRRAKYWNRISIAFSILLLFAVLSIAGSFLSSFYFNRGGENSLLYRTQKTAALLTEFSFPNVTMPLSFVPQTTTFSRAGWGHSSVEIKPYFVVTGSYAMQKQVGKESIVIGHLNVNHLFSSLMTQRQWADGTYQHYLHFYHPDQVSGRDDFVPAFSDEVWNALEILPEGTVAELAISFLETYSIDEVKAMLGGFDLDITWYAVATGFVGESQFNRDGPASAFHGAWGLPDLSRNMLFQFSQISSNDSVLREEYFLESMKFLVENDSIARRIYQGNPHDLLLNERYEYLKENGIQVYGVVVTGPTKELLKLQELENVHSPALGDVDLWNWFQRSFSGKMY
jgi:hypothetical protein